MALTLFDQVVSQVEVAEATTYLVVGNRPTGAPHAHERIGAMVMNAQGLAGVAELGELMGRILREQYGVEHATYIISALLNGVESGMTQP